MHDFFIDNLVLNRQMSFMLRELKVIAQR